MFSVALKQLIKEAMKNHIYSFNGQLRHQKSGLATGTTLSGALANLYMLRWCRLFKEKLIYATTEIRGFKLYMLLYYVDDGNLIISRLPIGSKICDDGKIRICEQQAEIDCNSGAEYDQQILLWK